MTITFDGTQKLIIADIGTTLLDVQEVYSAWKEWVRTEGIRFLPAFEAIGGQSLPGGLFAGRTFFLTNGWKFKPQEADHRLTIVGNLYTDDGSPVTVSVPGYTIEISLATSAQAQGVQTSGSAFSVADIWSHDSRTLTSAGASGGATLAEIEGSNVLAKVSDVQNVPAAVENQLADDLSSLSNAIANIPFQTWSNSSRTLTSGHLTLTEIEESTVLAKASQFSSIPTAVWSNPNRTLTTAMDEALTLEEIESSQVLAKSADITSLQSFITPYLQKIHTLWIGNGHDSTNPISAMPPSSLLPGWVRSQNPLIDQTHRQNQDGSFTLSSNV
ncbi:MAG: hypothetical protein F6K31_28410 [Symploca sp. SIO2G7]|nr:hypothetical protein [Symploca sp. SIO2G7]